VGESVVGHRTQVHNRIHEAIQEIRDDIVKLSLDLHRHPELSLQEYYASERLTDWLVQEGFEVERGVADLPTAFVARRGTKARPAVAFLLEYDALPDIGHACGHNLIASGGLAAATALRRALPDPSGSIVVIGTPGEEDGGGKIIELEKGVFDGIDAALMFHPGDRTIPWRHATATAHLVIKYHGKAAHAASNPQEGRNALAAMIVLRCGRWASSAHSRDRSDPRHYRQRRLGAKCRSRLHRSLVLGSSTDYGRSLRVGRPRDRMRSGSSFGDGDNG
jgi:metal-dependent amidase/aminoacylase/carboxypeptidase family protein